MFWTHRCKILRSGIYPVKTRSAAELRFSELNFFQFLQTTSRIAQGELDMGVKGCYRIQETVSSDTCSLTLREKGAEMVGRFKKIWDVEASLKIVLKGWSYIDEILKAYNKST